MSKRRWIRGWMWPALGVIGACGQATDDEISMESGGGMAGDPSTAAGGQSGGSETTLSGGAASGGVASGGAASGGVAWALGGTIASSGGSAGSGGGVGTGGGFQDFCLGDTFDVDPTDDHLTCTRWTICQPGTFQTKAGTPTSDRVCTPCPDGTYTPDERSFQCLPVNSCPLGTVEVAAPTPTSDRACEVGNAFPPIDLGLPAYYDYLTLEATSSAIHSASKSGVGRYSPDGTPLSPFRIASLTSTVLDMTKLGEEIVLVDTDYDLDEVSGFEGRVAIFRKFAADGTLAFSTEVGEPGETFMDVELAAQADRLYAVATHYTEHCPSGEYCAEEPSFDVVLLTLSTEGTLIDRQLIDNDNQLHLADLAITSDGRLFALGQRSDGVVNRNVMFEVTTAGDKVSEISILEAEWSVLPIVRSDSEGNVFAVHNILDENLRVTGSVTVTRWSGGASAPSTFELDLATGDSITAFDVTTDGLALSGVTEAGAPLFLTADFTGETQSLVVLDRYSGIARAVDQAPNGNLFFGGPFGEGVYALPWPSEAE